MPAVGSSALAGGRPLHAVRARRTTLQAHKDRVYAMARMGDAHVLTGSSDRTLKLWRVRDGAQLAVDADAPLLELVCGASNFRSAVCSIAVGGSAGTGAGAGAGEHLDAGARVYAGGSEHDVTVYDAGRGGELAYVGAMSAHTGTVWSLAEGAGMLASGSYDNSVRVWDPRTMRAVRTLDGHFGTVSALVMLDDGHTLASASWDRSVRLWDLRTFECTAHLRGHKHRLYCATKLQGHLLTGSRDGTVRLWGTPADAIAVEDGSSMACVQVLQHTVDGTLPVVRSLSSAHGRLCVGGEDGSVTLWDLERNITHTHAAHDGPVAACVALPDESALLTAGYDGRVVSWY